MSADGLSGAEKGTFHLRRRDRGGQKAELRESGDAANVVLSAVGHNFRRILAWLRDLSHSLGANAFSRANTMVH
jgi:hypothetical protein